MNAENMTIDDVLAYFKSVKDKIRQKRRLAQEMSTIMPPLEKMQEVQKLVAELIADWKFLQFKS